MLFVCLFLRLFFLCVFLCCDMGVSPAINTNNNNNNNKKYRTPKNFQYLYRSPQTNAFKLSTKCKIIDF